jgi:sortase A
LRKYLKGLLLAATISGLFVAFLFHVYQGAEERSLSTKPNQLETRVLGKTSEGHPVHLFIPAIGVSANIQRLGVEADGEMAVPSNTYDVGWFELGTRPGEKGSAVIAGHLNGKNGELGVFANLSKLKDGNIVYVEDDSGTVNVFVVRESRVYQPGFAENVFNANDGVYLNLVTCDGVWNRDINSFSKRLVVFTDGVAL